MKYLAYIASIFFVLSLALFLMGKYGEYNDAREAYGQYNQIDEGNLSYHYWKKLNSGR